jgi:7-cyano-7-deazaguanine synthase
MRDPCGRAVILLSGGIDSSTALAMTRAEGKELYALSFNYHQRHIRELESARMVAASCAVKKHLLVDFDLRDIGGSALTSDIAVPKAVAQGAKDSGERTATHGAPLHAPGTIPVTYVPARNTIFLSFALAWAEVLESETIVIGANAIDYSGYPDCRPEYLRAFEAMANLATKIAVEGRLKFSISAPLLSLTKAEIIKKGLALGLDYSLTWSCYDPQPPGGHKPEVGRVAGASAFPRSGGNYAPCGQCDSCRLREKGFREAGERDPLLSYGV